jgi:hypothetical protein
VCRDVCRPAFQYYSREVSAAIRDELIAEGKEAGMGNVVQVVSQRVSSRDSVFSWLMFIDWHLLTVEGLD